jgi:hypothetical protein
MKETTTRLTSSTYLGLQSFKSAWQRLSMMLLTVLMAFAGAQTAGAHTRNGLRRSADGVGDNG